MDLRLPGPAVWWTVSSANLYDVSADYKFGHGVSAALYFGWAQGGQVIKSISRLTATARSGHVELNYKF